MNRLNELLYQDEYYMNIMSAVNFDAVAKRLASAYKRVANTVVTSWSDSTVGGNYLHVHMDTDHGIVFIDQCDCPTCRERVKVYCVADIPIFTTDVSCVFSKHVPAVSVDLVDVINTLKSIFTQPNVQRDCMIDDKTFDKLSMYFAGDCRDENLLQDISDSAWKDISRCISNYLVNSLSDK